MTSEEAIDILKTHYHKNPRTTYGFKVKQATEMEAEALQKRKTGKWIKDIYGNVFCSECRANRRDNRIGHIAFCNSCGAKMEVEE